MPLQTFRITGHDPLLFRDGRPFSDELGALAARTLPLPTPGTLAGVLRTYIGDQLDFDWGGDGPERALAIPTRGPLLTQISSESKEAQVLLPAPADAVVYQPEEGGALQVMRLLPDAQATDSGCDLPGALQPLAVTKDEKPTSGFEFWSWPDMERWLDGSSSAAAPATVTQPPIEQRTHVAVNAESRTAEGGKLFSTEGLSFGCQWALLATAEIDGDLSPLALAPFGGERRLARSEITAASHWPTCPESVLAQMKTAPWVRMQLATPAVFSGGWKPGWLDDDLVGPPPGAPGCRLRLVAAAVPRRLAVSGWDLQKRGPKPVRWLAPGGSVYFFRLEEGDPLELVENCWLRSVCDDDQDRLDGYGLALWGSWSKD